MNRFAGEPKIPASVFKEGVDANLEAPQNMFVTAVMLTHEALKSPDFDPRILAHARADTNQIMWLGEIMERAHSSRGVPVATREGAVQLQHALDTRFGPGEVRVTVLPEGRLKGLWRGYQENALGILAAIAGIRNAGGHIITRSEIDESTSDLLAGELYRAFLNSEIRARVTRVFSSLNEASQSERGRALTARIRELNDYSSGQPTSTEKSERAVAKRVAVRALFNAMFAYCIEEEERLGNPPFLNESELVELALHYAR